MRSTSRAQFTRQRLWLKFQSFGRLSVFAIFSPVHNLLMLDLYEVGNQVYKLEGV